MKTSVLILVIFGIYFQSSNSLYFLLNEGKEKCIYDEIPEEEDVKLEYQLMDAFQISSTDKPIIEMKIMNPQSKLIKEIPIRDARKQTHAFLAPETGTYKFCFKFPNNGKSKQVRFKIRLSVGESDQEVEGVAKSGDFANMKEKAKKLDNKCQNYIKIQDMNREAEDKLYEVLQVIKLFVYQENEKIDEKVIFATVFQTLVILASGIFQIFSLRRFFIKIHVC